MRPTSTSGVVLSFGERISALLTPAQLAQPQPDGSYSIRRSGGDETAAKIVIFESSLAREAWRPGPDGVYVCSRTAGNRATRAHTVGFIPNSEERFAYFRLEASQNLDNLARFIVACSDY